MTESKFLIYRQFLKALRLTNNFDETSVYVLDITKISNEALATFRTYRNSFYEINIIKSQKQFTFYAGGVKHQPKGEPYIFFVSPNKLQSYQVLNEAKNGQGFCIYIPTTTASTIPNFEKLFTYFKSDFESYFQPNENVFNELWTIAQNLQLIFDSISPYKDNLLKSYLEIFLYKCLEYFANSKSVWTTHPEQIVGEFETLISENFATHKDLNFYAKTLSLTPKRLSEICKNVKGKNALTFIHDRQKDNAMALLLQTNLTIKEIALQMGFDEVSNFSRFFKKQTGITPIEFRTTKKN